MYISVPEKPRTKIFISSILATGVLLTAQTVQAANVWDMPTPYPEAEFHTKNVIRFAEDLDRMSNGQIKIKVHSAQSLFKHPEIKRAVRTGQVPIGELLMANMQNDDAMFGADVVPFLATSHAQAMTLYRVQRPYVEKRLMKRGMRLLYAVPWPGQGFYTKQTITRVDDLQGVKFRTYNAATARLAKLMGAVPTIVEAVEIPQAFATGIVDAMVTSGATGVRAKAWDFVQHFYDLNAWLPKNMVVVNERTFRKLTKAEQDALINSAAQAEKRGWQMSTEIAASSVKALGDNGIKVHVPSKALVSGLATLGQEMTREWGEAAGDDGKRLLREYSQE